MNDAMESAGTKGGERGWTAPGSSHEQPWPLSPRDPTLSTMSVSALAVQCKWEISNYTSASAPEAIFSVELLHRAIIDRNQEARACLQQCLGGLVRNWLHCHPSAKVACRLISEEQCVSEAFEHFWQVVGRTQKNECNSLAIALQYLHVCLNGALLEMLRVSQRPGAIPLPWPSEPETQLVEEARAPGEMWKALSNMLPDTRERRLAYLLFNCGLSPREIMQCCSQEFGDIREIYHLRYLIMQRILR
jgi:hypothetical protein